MVELRNVWLVCGSRVIVGAVDLVLRPGTFTAIIGPEGSGKTALLSLISGQVAPTIGSVAADECTRYILLDEPPNESDVANQYEKLAECSRMVDARVGVIAVLHDLDQAAIFADRVVLLECGHIVADGSPDVVLQPTVLQSIYRTRCSVTRFARESSAACTTEV